MDINLLTDEQMEAMDKSTLIMVNKLLQSNIIQLNKNVELLTEQVKILNQRSFGKKTETVSTLFEQASLDFGFNEAEYLSDKTVDEPTLEDLPKKKKSSGKKENSLKKITNHTEKYIELTESELNEKYGEGKWKRLPDQLISKLEHYPASFEVVTYHIGVYAKNDNQTIVRAEAPVELLPKSIVTPSLLSSILTAKYVNAVPLYRLEQSYQACDVNITRATMAKWCIMAGQDYFSLLYDKMRKDLVSYHLIHADETPFIVNKDNRKAGSKSYMWVYRTAPTTKAPPIILYNYQHTRNSTHPKEFLNGFTGTIVCDGYGGYHKLEKDSPETFIVAGCWVHLKRKFATIIKAKGPELIPNKAVNLITEIFHMTNLGEEMDLTNRLEYRQNYVKPLVDKFFQWVEEVRPLVAKESETGKGLTYAINQEKYLRTFLDNPEVPMDNNAAERAIRPFTIGRKNWVLIDTPKGADASAIIYSLVETAKANNLRIYDYFAYVLEELSKITKNGNREIPDSLLPYSSELPKNLYKTK